MKVKANKKKVITCVIILIILLNLITLPTFGRYIYHNARDLYLRSRNFSFSSNLLTATGRTYKYSNWSGVDDYELDFQLYSYENELSLFNYEGEGLKYTLTCTIDDTTKATAHIETAGGNSTAAGYIPNATNVKDVKVYLKPTESLKEGDTVKLTITANTTVPYKKQITATFNIKVSTNQGLSYSIVDEESSIYASLKLVNTKSEERKITLTYDPKLVLIDLTNPYCESRIKQTSTKIDGVEYINSITFNMEAEDVTTIRFYKKDINANYTYPGGSYGSMIVSITETN